jgi:hypothetical protein
VEGLRPHSFHAAQSLLPAQGRLSPKREANSISAIYINICPGAITEKMNRFAQSQALPGLRPGPRGNACAFDNTHLLGERNAANAPEGQMAFRENSRMIPFQCQRT